MDNLNAPMLENRKLYGNANSNGSQVSRCSRRAWAQLNRRSAFWNCRILAIIKVSTNVARDTITSRIFLLNPCSGKSLEVRSTQTLGCIREGNILPSLFFNLSCIVLHAPPVSCSRLIQLQHQVGPLWSLARSHPEKTVRLTELMIAAMTKYHVLCIPIGMHPSTRKTTFKGTSMH
jgi:hypothetical protein